MSVFTMIISHGLLDFFFAFPQFILNTPGMATFSNILITAPHLIKIKDFKIA